jgi:hypothetical protein
MTMITSDSRQMWRALVSKAAPAGESAAAAMDIALGTIYVVAAQKSDARPQLRR